MIHKTKTVLISSILALLTVVTTRNTQAQSLQSLTLEIHTADESWAGTDSDVFLQLFLGENDDQRDLKLDDPNDGNDFERNDRNTITLDHTNNLPSELWMIRMFRIHRNERSGPNDWKLAGIKIFMNGNPSLVLYENQNINTELDDDHPDWAPPVDAWVPPDPPPPPLPPCPLPQCRGPARPTGREGGGPYWIFPDRDCDGVDDAADNEFNPRDLDGDGLFDRCEDFDGDGVVDPEETDPNNRDTDGDGIPDPRDLLDTDADGLPDVYEDKNRNNQVDRGETDKNNPDTDGDGWQDGPTNMRLVVRLYRIYCGNEQEDQPSWLFGGDEFFPVNDDVRSPEDKDSLNGYYSMSAGQEVSPFMIIARRNTAPGLPQNFSWRLELWEEDSWLTWADDFLQMVDLTFNTSNTSSILSVTAPASQSHQTIRHRFRDDGDIDYTLEFAIDRWPFPDPNPLDCTADSDKDGLTERQEYDLCRGMRRVFVNGRETDQPLNGDFRGMSDPHRRDLFLELDSTGPDEVPEPYTKANLVSQFYYHNVTIHLADEDSRLGGGQILSSVLDSNGQPVLNSSDPVFLTWSDASRPRQRSNRPSVWGLMENPLTFTPARKNLFHYAVACDVKGPDNKEGNSSFGSADSPSIADDGTIRCTNPLRFANGSDGLVFKSDFLDHVSDMESIVFIHELGHNLGLCHRPGDQGDVADQARTRPANPSECDCCKFKIDTGEGTTNCTHYWVDSNSDTAMGASFFLRVKSAIAGGLGGAAGAAGGAGVGFVAGGLPGAFVGAAIGGIVGFFGGGYLHDLADREINYEDAEWEVIDLTTIRPQDPDTGPGCGDLP